MRKFLIAAAASLLLFGGQVEAATVENLGEQIEIQEQGKWAHFRDKHILGRETENERRDREEWERRYRHDYYHDRDRHHRGYRHDPPPRHGYGAPPPPRRGYGYPSPPRR